MREDLNRRKRILLVDDDEDLLLLMSGNLKSEGFDISISPNAANISAIINIKHPDLIFLDIHMNGIDGGQICKKLKSSPDTANIPIVMFSANDNIALIADQCGADAFIPKPFNSKEVRLQAHRFLG